MFREENRINNMSKHTVYRSIILFFILISVSAYKPCWRDCEGVYTLCGHVAPRTFYGIRSCVASRNDCRANCKRKREIETRRDYMFRNRNAIQAKRSMDVYNYDDELDF